MIPGISAVTDTIFGPMGAIVEAMCVTTGEIGVTLAGIKRRRNSN